MTTNSTRRVPGSTTAVGATVSEELRGRIELHAVTRAAVVAPVALTWLHRAMSNIWSNHVPMDGGPAGFTLRTTYPTNPQGVDVMLERWQAGTSEPPHSHPGDDMTVVVEGRMSIQFFLRTNGVLVPDGEPVILTSGETGYVKAGRIHDATYLDECKLVYVHDRAFGFTAEA